MSLNWSRCAQSLFCELAFSQSWIWCCSCVAGQAALLCIHFFSQTSWRDACAVLDLPDFVKLLACTCPAQDVDWAQAKTSKKESEASMVTKCACVSVYVVRSLSQPWFMLFARAFPHFPARRVRVSCSLSTPTCLWSAFKVSSFACYIIIEVPARDVWFLISFIVRRHMWVSAGILLTMVLGSFCGGSFCFTWRFSLSLILQILEWWPAWTGSEQPSCQPCYHLMSVGSQDAQRVSWDAVCFDCRMCSIGQPDLFWSMPRPSPCLKLRNIA